MNAACHQISHPLEEAFLPLHNTIGVGRSENTPTFLEVQSKPSPDLGLTKYAFHALSARYTWRWLQMDKSTVYLNSDAFLATVIMK